jgi:hypothetical protein
VSQVLMFVGFGTLVFTVGRTLIWLDNRKEHKGEEPDA